MMADIGYGRCAAVVPDGVGYVFRARVKVSKPGIHLIVTCGRQGRRPLGPGIGAEDIIGAVISADIVGIGKSIPVSFIIHRKAGIGVVDNHLAVVTDHRMILGSQIERGCRVGRIGHGIADIGVRMLVAVGVGLRPGQINRVGVIKYLVISRPLGFPFTPVGSRQYGTIAAGRIIIIIPGIIEQILEIHVADFKLSIGGIGQKLPVHAA